MKAEKNGIQREFTQRQWDAMGDDKMGWVVVPVDIISNQPTHQSSIHEETPVAKQKRRKK